MVEQTKLRLDKWLWAARFFKTRALAKKAIEGGKIHHNGQRCKVSKLIEVGTHLHIRQGYVEKEVQVMKLGDQRQAAPIAQTLYEETPASIEKRQQQELARKSANMGQLNTLHRPNKKQRRDLAKFKQTQQESE